jgi:hypothetical protein
MSKTCQVGDDLSDLRHVRQIGVHYALTFHGMNPCETNNHRHRPQCIHIGLWPVGGYLDRVISRLWCSALAAAPSSPRGRASRCMRSWRSLDGDDRVTGVGCLDAGLLPQKQVLSRQRLRSALCLAGGDLGRERLEKRQTPQGRGTAMGVHWEDTALLLQAYHTSRTTESVGVDSLCVASGPTWPVKLRLE